MSFTIRTLEDSRPKRRGLRIGAALAVAGLVAAPLLALRHTKKQEQEHVRKSGKILQRVFLVLLAVLCAFVIVAGTVKGLMAVKVITPESIASVTGTPPPVDALGYTNLLLLGQGDAGHDGKDLTDTIMVASIDTTNKNSVLLLSLPRDLYFLKTEKMGKGRINSMYRDYKSFLRFRQGLSEEEAQKEALSELSAEVGRKLDIEIHHVLKVDFIGFEKAVDELGGITVDVPYEIVDTEYPDNNYGYETFRISAGTQTLDGATALKYARSRHTTSDFDRSARQQQILGGMAEKAREIGIIEDGMQIAGLLRILSEHVSTSMTISEIIGLAAAAKDVERSNLITMQISDRNGLYGSVPQAGGFLYTPPRDLFDGASVLLPVSIPEFPISWKQLRALIVLFQTQRDVYLRRPTIALLNADAASGTARKLANEFTRYGFAVEIVANASVDGAREVSTVSHRSVELEPHGTFFAKLLGMESQVIPPELPPEEQADITIILGSDYTYTPLQDTIVNLNQ